MGSGLSTNSLGSYCRYAFQCQCIQRLRPHADEDNIIIPSVNNDVKKDTKLRDAPTSSESEGSDSDESVGDSSGEEDVEEMLRNEMVKAGIVPKD